MLSKALGSEGVFLRAPYWDPINSGSKAQHKGMPQIMVCRIFVFMRSFGSLIQTQHGERLESWGEAVAQTCLAHGKARYPQDREGIVHAAQGRPRLSSDLVHY